MDYKVETREIIVRWGQNWDKTSVSRLYFMIFRYTCENG